MTFQIGNKLGGRKEKPFRDALIMELKSAGEDFRELRKIARVMIKTALNDDHKDQLSAAKEIADRIDGKVAQTTTIEGEQTVVHEVRWTVVDSRTKDIQRLPPVIDAETL